MNETNDLNVMVAFAELMKILGEYQKKMEDKKLTNNEFIYLLKVFKNSFLKFVNLKNEGEISQTIDVSLDSVVEIMEIWGFDTKVLIEGKPNPDAF